jgi:hypothetical protein
MKRVSYCLILLLMFLPLAGCQNFAQSQKLGTLASGALAENLDTTDRELNIAATTADLTTKSHIVSAQASNTAAKAKLPAINKSLDDFDKVNKDDQRQHNSYWSDRQRAQFWRIVGCTVGLVTLIAALYFFTSFSGPIGSIATVVFHISTLGIAWIVGRFSKWVTNLRLAKAKGA